MKITRIIIVVLLLSLLYACSGYYRQSVQGQLHIFSVQQPIESLLENPPATLDSKTQTTLKMVLSARQYATETLGLPDNKSFTLYADLQRPYVVWSVMASPKLSLESTQWCYPVVGCAAYRGYFKQADATAFAETLKQQGLDVTVIGVPAYSTLGWFDDPIFHSVLSWPKTAIVGLIFHELAHAQLYVKGDSTFNESYATAIEIAGVRQWLSDTNQTELLAQFEKKHELKQHFIQFVMQYRSYFTALYKSTASVPEKRQAKADLMTQMQSHYRLKKIQWQSDAYDPWMAQLNNAKLNSLSTYYEHVPAMLKLIEKTASWREFYAQSEQLGELPITERNAKLQSIP